MVLRPVRRLLIAASVNYAPRRGSDPTITRSRAFSLTSSRVPPMPSQPSKTLETFPNPAPQRDFCIRMRIPEFTCLCPMTGQPDFGTLYLEYVADKKCVELKALKMYIRSEEHTSELQSLMRTSYAVFCLKKKNTS